jgi:phospholipid/cholesterol/gamma-HCH transport system substrate-binding protein
MSVRATSREVLVGLVCIVALGGLMVMLVMAGGGPGFLAAYRTIDVDFHDGQGVREGSSVRIAGIDAGRVTAVNLVDSKAGLRARVRIALPDHLVRKLRQDVRITIQPGLTGQSRVNVVSSGDSGVALAPGQVVQGIESSFFDPILEQAGLGPVERKHLSHMIAEIRETVDATTPRVRLIVAALQETANGIRESSDTLRPAVETTAGQLEDIAKKLNAASPKLENALGRVDALTAQADHFFADNRESLRGTLGSLHDLTATLSDATTKNRPRIEQLLVNLEGTRARADRLLYSADVMASQGAQMMTRNRADMERTIANVRDATDWADKLVQKIYANPFVLSPFYKPTPEDARVSTVYDTAQVFTRGAQELNDLVRTLDTMQSRATTPAQLQEVAQLRQNILVLTQRLDQTSQLLAEGLKRPVAAGRVRR